MHGEKHREIAAHRATPTIFHAREKTWSHLPLRLKGKKLSPRREGSKRKETRHTAYITCDNDREFHVHGLRTCAHDSPITGPTVLQRTRPRTSNFHPQHGLRYSSIN